MGDPICKPRLSRALVVGIWSNFTLHIKQFTFWGTSWVQLISPSFVVVSLPSILDLRMSTWNDLSLDMLHIQLSHRGVSWKLLTMSRSMSISLISAGRVGADLQSHLIPLCCIQSLILQRFFRSNLYNYGKDSFNVVSPIHMSGQNMVWSPLPTFFEIISFISIPNFSSSACAPATFFHTPGIVFLDMKAEGLLWRLWIPLMTLDHKPVLSTLNLHHHFTIRDRFRALSEPNHRPPSSLGAITLSHATLYVFFLICTTLKESSF